MPEPEEPDAAPSARAAPSGAAAPSAAAADALERGNGLFREGRWEEAETSYSEALDRTSRRAGLAAAAMRLRGLANRAAARLKTGGGAAGALADCRAALRLGQACRAKRALAFKSAARMVEASEVLSDHAAGRHALAAARYYQTPGSAEQVRFVDEAAARLGLTLGSPDEALNVMRFASSLGSPAELAARAAACLPESPDRQGNHLLCLLSEMARPPGPVLPEHREGERCRQRVALESLRLVLEAGAPPDAQTPGKPTALMVAAECGSLEAMGLLLGAGANPEAVNDSGCTVLHAALFDPRGRVPVVRALLEAGADADTRSGEAEASPLLAFAKAAMFLGPVEGGACDPEEVATVFSLLLGAGARQDAANRDQAFGLSPVAVAALAFGDDSPPVCALLEGAHPEDRERVREDVKVVRFQSFVNEKLSATHNAAVEASGSGQACGPGRDGYRQVALSDAAELLALSGVAELGPEELLAARSEDLVLGNPLEKVHTFIDSLTPETVRTAYTSRDLAAVQNKDERGRLKLLAGAGGAEQQHYFDSVQMRGQAGPVFVSPGWSAYFHLVQLPLQCLFSSHVPSEAALAAICEHGPVVEIGAGSGYWAALLRARGVDVLAFDVLVKEEGGGRRGLAGQTFFHQWSEVVEGGAEALRGPAAAGRALLLTAPESERGAEAERPWAIEALEAFQGGVLLHAGVPGRGLATWLPERFRLAASHPLPPWPAAPAPALSVWRRL